MTAGSIIWMELVFKGLLPHLSLQLIDLTDHMSRQQLCTVCNQSADLSLGKGVVLLKLARFLRSCLLA